MKMYLISDNVDTLTGMRLAGVDGIVVHERDELKEAIEKAGLTVVEINHQGEWVNITAQKR